MASCGSMTFTKQKRKKISAKAKMTNSFLTELSGNIASPFLLLIAGLCVRYDSHYVGGVLVQTPSNKTVIANHSTSFNCSTNNSNLGVLPLTWYHYPVGDTNAKGVYERGKIRTKYEGRFDVEPDSTSDAFNLLVQIPNREDAGTYECREDPYVPGASANLTILDSNPICESNMSLQEVVGNTQCTKAIYPDKMMFSCRVNYSGNIAPQMTWIQKDTASVLNTTCYEDRDKVFICNTTLDGNLVRDGSVFVCQIQTAEQYNCSLKVNRTIYAFSENSVSNITLMDEEYCSANTSADLPCSYEWIKDNNTEQSGQTLIANKTGTYSCVATCTIRNEPCTFTVKEINVFSKVDEAEKNDSSQGSLWILGVVFGVIAVVICVVICVVIGIVFYTKHRKADREVQRQQQANGTGLPGEEIPLQSQQPQQANGRAEEEIQPLLDSNDANENADLERFVEEACNDKLFPVGKGLNGDLYPPKEYKGRHCAFEKVTFTLGQCESTREEEETEINQFLIKGEKWKALNHVNVITFYYVVKLPPAVVIVMEHAAGGTVRDTLNTLTEDLLPAVVICWAQQIAQGMKFLHENNIIHGDLQCARISIMEPFELGLCPTAHAKLKVTCNRLACKENATSSKMYEEIAWKAPLAMFSGETLTKRCDVWSFGVTVWEIMTRRIPHHDKSLLEKVKIHSQGKLLVPIPESGPLVLRDLFTECFDQTPEKEETTFGKIITSYLDQPTV